MSVHTTPTGRAVYMDPTQHSVFHVFHPHLCATNGKPIEDVMPSDILLTHAIDLMCLLCGMIRKKTHDDEEANEKQWATPHTDRIST